VNERNIVVGWSARDERNATDVQAVVWLPDHGTHTWRIQRLDTSGFDGYSNWRAFGINNSGQIVGTALQPHSVAVVWNPLPDGRTWKIMKLEVPEGYAGSFARDINERGVIAGSVTTPSSDILPVVWEPRARRSDDDRQWSGWQAQLLAAVWGSQTTTWRLGWASGLNDNGDIVGLNGYNAGAGDVWVAVFWRIDQPQAVHQLFPTISRTFASGSLEVNDNHIATGDWVFEPGLQRHAFAIRIPYTHEGKRE
jgi:uncharacterized membrane protein